MSLLSKEALKIVLNKVAIQQIRALDRLTLAIPIQELFSYYEAQLLQYVVTLPHGIMLKMTKPLASRRTVMTTYQALPLPMPQMHDVEAIQWEIQSSCLCLLFFGTLVQAMKVCDVNPVTLPIKERAVSRRYGIWLITAASADYSLTESYMNSSTPVGSSWMPNLRRHACWRKADFVSQYQNSF